jgi:hemerythrin superfamily protein
MTSTSTANNANAIALLAADHRRVEKLFKEYFRLTAIEAPADDKEALAAAICTELTVHMQVEEEIFYPVARDALDREDLIDEAIVEHASVKDLIVQLADMSPDDDLYDAKVKVMRELVEHHVREEEGQMFPKLNEAKLDVAALALRMLNRKQHLFEELGIFIEEPVSDGIEKHR